MSATNPNKALQTAILAVMAKVSVVKKDKKHGQGFDFTSDAAMVMAVRGAMREQGLTIAPVDIDVIAIDVAYRTKSGADMHRITAKWTWRVSHLDGGTLEFKTLGAGCDQGDKHVFKAATGAKKYALEQLFLIARSNTLEPETEPKVEPESTRHENAEARQQAEPEEGPAICPKCGSQMRDHRTGKQNPSYPDFICLERNKIQVCRNEQGKASGFWLHDSKGQLTSEGAAILRQMGVRP